MKNIILLTFKDLWVHRLQWLRVLFTPLLFLALLNATTALMRYSLWEASGDAALIIPFFYILNCALMITNSVRYAFLREGGECWWQFPVTWRLLLLAGYSLTFLLLTWNLDVFWKSEITQKSFEWLPFNAQTDFSVEALQESVNQHYHAAFQAMKHLAVGLVSLYLTGRLLLTFFFIIIDHPRPLRTSWRTTAHNGWRMVLYFIVGTILLHVLGTLTHVSLWLPKVFPSLSTHGTWPLICDQLMSLVRAFITYAALGKALSLVYISLKKQSKT